MILFVLCFLLAAFLVWAFWPEKKQPPRVEARPVEEFDWDWPTGRKGHDRIGESREPERVVR